MCRSSANLGPGYASHLHIKGLDVLVICKSANSIILCGISTNLGTVKKHHKVNKMHVVCFLLPDNCIRNIEQTLGSIVGPELCKVGQVTPRVVFIILTIRSMFIVAHTRPLVSSHALETHLPCTQSPADRQLQINLQALQNA